MVLLRPQIMCLLCLLPPPPPPPALLQLYLQDMEVPKLEMELELQLLAHATATVTPDPRYICDLCHSLQQLQSLNPLIEARDQTLIFMDAMSSS